MCYVSCVTGKKEKVQNITVESQGKKDGDYSVVVLTLWTAALNKKQGEIPQTYLDVYSVHINVICSEAWG